MKRERPMMSAAVVLMVLFALLTTGRGGAQEAPEDPYGSTTTTTEGSGDVPDCTLSAGSGEAGARITATVTNVPGGSTVRILFDGSEVAQGTADDATATATVTLSFTVPDVPPGSYVITAVGDTFTQRCGFGDGESFAVLGATTGQGGGGSLPKTGVYAALLVTIALVLVLVGRVVLSASRRRKQAAGSGYRPRHHTPSAS